MGLVDRGNGGSPWHDERPMFFVGGARVDPTFEDFLLGGRHRAVRLGRRHDLVLILGEEALDQLAAGGIPRDESLLFQGFLTDIQTEFALALVRVGSVAIETVLGQDRANIPIVLEG